MSKRKRETLDDDNTEKAKASEFTLLQQEQEQEQEITADCPYAALRLAWGKQYSAIAAVVRLYAFMALESATFPWGFHKELMWNRPVFTYNLMRWIDEKHVGLLRMAYGSGKQILRECLRIAYEAHGWRVLCFNDLNRITYEAHECEWRVECFNKVVNKMETIVFREDDPVPTILLMTNVHIAGIHDSRLHPLFETVGKWRTQKPRGLRFFGSGSFTHEMEPVVKSAFDPTEEEVRTLDASPSFRQLTVAEYRMTKREFYVYMTTVLKLYVPVEHVSGVPAVIRYREHVDIPHPIMEFLWTVSGGMFQILRDTIKDRCLLGNFLDQGYNTRRINPYDCGNGSYLWSVSDENRVRYLSFLLLRYTYDCDSEDNAMYEFGNHSFSEWNQQRFRRISDVLRVNDICSLIMSFLPMQVLGEVPLECSRIPEHDAFCREMFKCRMMSPIHYLGGTVRYVFNFPGGPLFLQEAWWHLWTNESMPHANYAKAYERLFGVRCQVPEFMIRQKEKTRR